MGALARSERRLRLAGPFSVTKCWARGCDSSITSVTIGIILLSRAQGGEGTLLGPGAAGQWDLGLRWTCVNSPLLSTWLLVQDGCELGGKAGSLHTIFSI